MRTLSTLIAVLLFSFIGCTSIYTVSNFPSKGKFYSDFNNFVKDKKVKITLVNGNSFYSSGTLKIVNDSLILIKRYTAAEKINKSEILNMKYKYNGTDFSNITVYIFLKNGKVLNVKDVSTLPDSSIEYYIVKNDTVNIPLNKIKDVSYNKHWLGVPFGVLTGGLLGLV